MVTIEVVFGVGWAAFWIYWIVAALATKRSLVPMRQFAGVRVVLVLVVLVVFRAGLFRGHGTSFSPLRAGIGLALFGAGLLVAIWARVHLGKNWGTPMSKSAEPELVTSGPYRLVRHPIYSGLLLALVGTAVALNWFWLIVAAAAGTYFIYSATVEERTMTEAFPEAYPAYVRSSKMLVPYVF